MKPMGTRSMLGDQVNSRRASAPKFGFGSATRAQAGKVFMSSEHAKLATVGFSPGPAYNLVASVGTQVDGQKASSPQWVFGSADRFMGNTKPSHQNPGPGSYDMPNGVGMQVSSAKASQPMFGFGTAGRQHVEKVFVSEEHNKSLYGVDSPGPVSYTLDSSVGRQGLSQKANQPKWVFSTGERFSYDHVKRAAGSPGPGSYSMGQSVGPQVSSSMHSSPMAKFGTATRELVSKVYISHEHEKAQSGNCSPGPCSYAVPDGNGKQASSRIRSAPTWGFGTAARWSDKAHGQLSTPGPGSYCI